MSVLRKVVTPRRSEEGANESRSQRRRQAAVGTRVGNGRCVADVSPGSAAGATRSSWESWESWESCDSLLVLERGGRVGRGGAPPYINVGDLPLALLHHFVATPILPQRAPLPRRPPRAKQQRN